MRISDWSSDVCSSDLTHWRWRRAMPYYVYILASRKHGTLYIGVTNDIARRVWEHRESVGSRFVMKYRVTRLVHVEAPEEIASAIQREKTKKEWPRPWTIRLIQRSKTEGAGLST